MRRGKNRNNWRIMYGQREMGRWRGSTAEAAIVNFCAARGVDPRGLTAEDLGMYDAERTARTQAEHEGNLVFRDGQWVAE